VLQAQLFECLQQPKKALKTFKKAKQMAYNNQYISFIDSEISRVKDKIKPKKKAAAKKEKSTKTKKSKK
jgi:hypothetical protein